MKLAWRKSIFVSIILIALGVAMMNMSEATKTIGTVFIALGGFFLIVSFRAKQMEEKKNKEQEK